MAVERHVQIGDIIETKVTERIGLREYVRGTRKYRVLRRYQHHVLCEDTKTGQKRSFCYGDLIVMGLETQEEN